MNNYEKDFFKAMKHWGPGLSDWDKVSGWFLGGTILDPLDTRSSKDKTFNPRRDFVSVSRYGRSQKCSKTPPEALCVLSDELLKGEMTFHSDKPMRLVTVPYSVSSDLGIEAEVASGWDGGFDLVDYQDSHPLLRSICGMLLPRLAEYLDQVILVVFVENPGGEELPRHEFAMFLIDTPFPLAARVLRAWMADLPCGDKT